MYRLCNKQACIYKLVCLFKTVKWSDNRKDTSLYEICQFYHELWARNALEKDQKIIGSVFHRSIAQIKTNRSIKFSPS